MYTAIPTDSKKSQGVIFRRVPRNFEFFFFLDAFRYRNPDETVQNYQ